MTQRPLPLPAGFHVGPLFVPRLRKQLPRMQSTYRARFLVKRIPAWANRKEFWHIRIKCRRITEWTGVQHSQDHIVPLNRPQVCGLHCPANIRIVPLSENLKKSNSWWPDMWNEQMELI